MHDNTGRAAVQHALHTAGLMLFKFVYAISQSSLNLMRYKSMCKPAVRLWYSIHLGPFTPDIDNGL